MEQGRSVLSTGTCLSERFAPDYPTVLLPNPAVRTAIFFKPHGSSCHLRTTVVAMAAETIIYSPHFPQKHHEIFHSYRPAIHRIYVL
jgi:hypothetical protein